MAYVVRTFQRTRNRYNRFKRDRVVWPFWVLLVRDIHVMPANIPVINTVLLLNVFGCMMPILVFTNALLTCQRRGRASRSNILRIPLKDALF